MRSNIDVVGGSYSFHFAVTCVVESTRSQEQAISAMMAEGISVFDGSVSVVEYVEKAQPICHIC